MNRASVAWLLGLVIALACSSRPSCVGGQCGRGGGPTEIGGGAGGPAAAGGAAMAGTVGEGGSTRNMGGALTQAAAGAGAGSGVGGAGGDAGLGPGAECEAAPQPIAVLKQTELVELSGLVASRRNPGVLYVHNDSGDSARFFAIDQAGNTLAEYALTGATAVDWEDAALGPGPGGGDFLYFGDTGDNAARSGNQGREQIVVYRVPEPTVSVGQPAAGSATADWVALTFTYPDAAHDCEALAVDPRGPSLVLVTKEDDGRSKLFGGSALTADATPRVLVELAAVRFGTPGVPGSALVTSADISPAGDAFVVRTYESIHYWPWASGANLATALAAPPRLLPAPPEPQGEAIAFAPDGRHFFTVSERVLAEPVALYRACIE